MVVGAVRHWLRIEGKVEGLFDVAVLPGVVRPKALSSRTPDLGQQFSFVDGGRVHFGAGLPTNNPPPEKSS